MPTGRAESTLPELGLRFDETKLLLDPYGRGVIFPASYDRPAATIVGKDTIATSPRSVVVDPAEYDWEGDLPLRQPVFPDGDLRDARGRLYPPPQFGRGTG